jgi:RNA polymerase sigma factor (sigma-70 family)
MDGMNDGRLLERFVIHKDQAAFEALVRRHGPMVRRVCRRFLDNEAAAEDACQETFIVFLRKAHLLGRPERLAGWLYGVASRTARRAKGRAERRKVCEKQAASAKVADAFAEVSRRELCTIVAAEVNRLPEKFRSPLILYYWEGKTSEEVARQLGCPTGSMSYRLGRGRELLRRQLGGLAKETAR